MELSQGKLNRAMGLNIAFGAMGSAWYIVNSPQAIFNVFVKNHLHASSSVLGIIVAVVQLSALFQLASIFIYGALPRIKPYWIIVHTLHRLFGLVLAGISLHAAFGGSRSAGLEVILYTISLSWILMNASASGWWSWVADLVPERIRGSFFLKRSAVINVANIVWFLSATLLLDTFAGRNVFFVYAFIFGVGGIAGLLDTVLHVLIPEPRPQSAADEKRIPIGMNEFLEPLRNRNFIGFAFAIGLATFSINILSPFISPYITAPDAIGAENTWLGIMYVISQLMWIATAPLWGVLMDRFGRKPVVVLGTLFTGSWIGYLFLTTANYVYLLPLISLAGGMLSPAFWEGANQMMLTLTPQKNRIAYVSWYMTIVGIVSSGGSLLGGKLLDLTAELTVRAGAFTFTGFHLVLGLTLALVAVSVFVLSRVREGKEKPVGYVVSRITNPGIFRTFVNMGIIGNTTDSSRITRALRSIEGAESDIALEEVLARLDDPHPDVREEAARALGRIGSLEAVTALIERLQDPGSTIRAAAARALGKIGDRRAVPYLIQGLASSSEDLQEACIRALGEIGGSESEEPLLRLFDERRSDRVMASGAEAAARLGIFEAAWEILPRMHGAENPVLRNQLAIAIGNLLGPPGRFYQYISGNLAQRAVRIERLQTEAMRSASVTSKKYLELYRKTAGHERMVAARTEMLARLKAVREQTEQARYAEALRSLHAAGKLFVGLAVGKEITEDEAYLDLVFVFDPQLGLWWWFLQETASYAARAVNPEALKTDILLGLYFLRYYLCTVEEEEGDERIGSSQNAP